MATPGLLSKESEKTWFTWPILSQYTKIIIIIKSPRNSIHFCSFFAYLEWLWTFELVKGRLISRSNGLGPVVLWVVLVSGFWDYDYEPSILIFESLPRFFFLTVRCCNLSMLAKRERESRKKVFHHINENPNHPFWSLSDGLSLICAKLRPGYGPNTCDIFNTEV